MKRFKVCGIGNGIVDILVRVDEKTFNQLGAERGTMRLVDAHEQGNLLEQVSGFAPVLASGGSVANSVIGLVQLGGTAAMICRLGDDRYGIHYQEEFSQLGIELGSLPIVGRDSGTSAILVTPDGERTMRTCLATSAELSENEINPRLIEDSEWIFIEGYVLANGEAGQRAALKAVEIAKKVGTKVALTISEAFVVQVFGDITKKIAGQSDLVFANESEACALSGETSVERAFERLSNDLPGVAVTAGSRGAFCSINGEKCNVASYECMPVDLTGAGDMFAGSVLYGLTHGKNLERSARAACFLAMKVITQVGPRLQSGTREFWDQAY